MYIFLVFAWKVLLVPYRQDIHTFWRVTAFYNGRLLCFFNILHTFTPFGCPCPGLVSMSMFISMFIYMSTCQSPCPCPCSFYIHAVPLSMFMSMLIWWPTLFYLFPCSSSCSRCSCQDVHIHNNNKLWPQSHCMLIRVGNNTFAWLSISSYWRSSCGLLGLSQHIWIHVHILAYVRYIWGVIWLCDTSSCIKSSLIKLRQWTGSMVQGKSPHDRWAIPHNLHKSGPQPPFHTTSSTPSHGLPVHAWVQAPSNNYIQYNIWYRSLAPTIWMYVWWMRWKLFF